MQAVEGPSALHISDPTPTTSCMHVKEGCGRTLSCEQLLQYSSDVARLLTDDEDDADDEDDDAQEQSECPPEAEAEAAAAAAAEEEEEEEAPIVSRAAIRAQEHLHANIPLAAFSSHLYQRSSPERPAAGRDSFVRPGSSAHSPGRVAAGGGTAGARILGLASVGVSASPASSSAAASTGAGAVIPAAPAPKKIARPPETRTCSFELHRTKTVHPEAAIYESSEQEADIWTPEQVVMRHADLRFRVGGGLYTCVRKCLERNGFRPCTPGEADWNIFWGRPLRLNEFAELDQYQKVNHFPGTNVLGRKDQLARACQRARRLWGSEEIDFLPKTWVLPSDRSELATDVEDKDSKTMYIVKPPDGCKGQGIRIYNDPIAHTRPSLACVVSRYIAGVGLFAI